MEFLRFDKFREWWALPGESMQREDVE